MSNQRKIKVALAGLAHGAKFMQAYALHPGVELVAVCERNEGKLQAAGEAHEGLRCFARLADMLQDSDAEMVHIDTSFLGHGEDALACLQAGKHVACSPPMAITTVECREILSASSDKGLRYILMIPTLFNWSHAKFNELSAALAPEDIQHVQAVQTLQLQGQPVYWHGLPPMVYSAHALAPCMARGRWLVEYLSGMGSGRLEDRMVAKYGSPYAQESALLRFKNSSVSAALSCSLFGMSAPDELRVTHWGRTKSFASVVGQHEQLTVSTGREQIVLRPGISGEEDLAVLMKFAKLRQRLAPYQSSTEPDDFLHGEVAVQAMVHDAISALLEGRDLQINELSAANLTCAGILAHESALAGGEVKTIPDWASGSRAKSLESGD